MESLVTLGKKLIESVIKGGRLGALLLSAVGFCVPALLSAYADTDFDCSPTTFTGKITYYSYDGSAGDSSLGLAHCAYSQPTLPGGTTIGSQMFAAIASDLYSLDLCGACAEITSTSGHAVGTKVTVMITDECPAATNPKCGANSNHIDVSENAFKLINGNNISDGEINVTWKVVPCPSNLINVKGQNGANLTYTFKDGASTGWAALIIRDFVMPIRSVEYCTGSGSGCTAATWQNYGVWTPTGSYSTFYLRITDKGGNVSNFGPISCCSPMKSAGDGVGGAGTTNTSSIYANLPGGQMIGCGVATATPTFTKTPTTCVCSPTFTMTPTPTPADCPLVLNTCDSLTANGTWVGANATRSIGSFTGMTGAGALQVAVTAASSYNNGIANLSAFTPINLSQYDRLTVDVFVPSSGMPWSGGTYHQLSLRGTHSGGAAPYQYEVGMGPIGDLPIDGTANANVVAQASVGGTIYKLSYPLAFGAGTSMTAASALEVDTLHFILNISGQSAGSFYLDNIVLHTDAVCPPATATPTLTRTPSPTSTRTSTPPSSFTSTVTPSRTSTGTPSDTGTLTNSPTSSNTPLPATSTSTRTATPTFTSSVTPSGTRTVTLTATPSNTAIPATFTSTITVSSTGTPTRTVTSTPTSTNTAVPPTSTSSITPSRTVTGTSTSTASPSFTRTITVTSTMTDTPLPGSTFTDTSTVSPTFSPTYTRTPTSTNTAVVPTSTPTSTITGTFSRTATPTYSSTVVLPSSTSTHTPLPGSTFTDTSTISPTFSFTRTITPSITVTSTPSNTVVLPSSTSTHTPLPGSTFTDTSTVTPLSTATSSITPTPTFSQTLVVPSATSTHTPLPGSTFTDTSTVTATFSVTKTITPTFTRTNTPLAGATATPTFSVTTVGGGGAPGEGSVTVSPSQVNVGASGQTFTFTYTAVNAWVNGRLTLQGVAGWPAYNLSNGLAQGFVTVSSSGTGISTSTVTASTTTLFVDVASLPAGGTITITFGSTSLGGPGVTAPSAAGLSTFTVLTAPSGGAGAGIASQPTIDVKVPTPTFTPTGDAEGPNEIEQHAACPSPWNGTSPLYIAAKLSGHCDRLVLKVYTRSLVCVGTSELGPQNAGWTKIAAPTDFMLNAANGGYFYIVTAERDGQKNITKAIGKLLVLR